MFTISEKYIYRIFRENGITKRNYDIDSLPFDEGLIINFTNKNEKTRKEHYNLVEKALYGEYDIEGRGYDMMLITKLEPGYDMDPEQDPIGP